MNEIELNAILYYADFLSLKHTNHPVTDNCKYFYIHGVPINSLFILNLRPEYDENNVYFKQAKFEYETIKNKYGDEGIDSFIEDICSIRACGTVDAYRMLQCIHQYSNKKLRNQAINTYINWKNNQKYTHFTINERGDPQETRCTQYVYHIDRMLGRSQLAKSPGTYGKSTEIYS